MTVPGVLDFYGDWRIGGPFGVIGGFNKDLGWSTTNNAPDLDEIYSLDVDPTKPETFAVRVQLETSRTLKGTVVGPDGKPLAGARAVGLSWSESPTALDSAEFAMTGPRPGARRLLIFIHEEKKLAAVQPVSGDATEPVAVKLAPLGSAAGRVMKSATEPGAGFTITAGSPSAAARFISCSASAFERT